MFLKAKADSQAAVQGIPVNAAKVWLKDMVCTAFGGQNEKRIKATTLRLAIEGIVDSSCREPHCDRGVTRLIHDARIFKRAADF